MCGWTGTSAGARSFAETFCDWMIERVEDKDGYVLELASNDGTFLKPSRLVDSEVLGVDPASNIAEIAKKDGIPTRVAFWGGDEARKLLDEKGAARIVFARNVLPHVEGRKTSSRMSSHPER